MQTQEELKEIILRQKQQLDWYSSKLRELTDAYYPSPAQKKCFNFWSSIKMSLRRNGFIGTLLKIINPKKLYYFILKHLQ